MAGVLLNQTGPYNIYVTSLRHPGATWQLSPEEGYIPRWSPKGSKILFCPTRDDSMCVASYSVNGDSFVPGPVKETEAKSAPIRCPITGNRHLDLPIL